MISILMIIIYIHYIILFKIINSIRNLDFKQNSYNSINPFICKFCKKKNCNYNGNNPFRFFILFFLF